MDIVRQDWVRKSLALERFSIVWMIGEGLVALVAGATARSLSLEAFGLDSLVEIISAWVVLWRLQVEATSPDATRRIEAAERRAARIVALCLFALAFYVVIGVMQSLMTREVPHPNVWGFIVAVAAIVVMPVLWNSKRAAGLSLRSKALEEDGVGNLTCGWMALILLLGLIAQRWGWWWADPAASVGLGVFVVREGLEAWKHARGALD